jgi:hypothetical protein
VRVSCGSSAGLSGCQKGWKGYVARGFEYSAGLSPKIVSDKKWIINLKYDDVHIGKIVGG